MLHLPTAAQLEEALVAVAEVVDVKGGRWVDPVVDVRPPDVVHGHLDEVPAREQWRRDSIV